MQDMRIVMRTKMISGRDEPEVMELVVRGSMVRKGQSVYFRYVERLPEGEIQNTVKFDGHGVTVIRSGALDMRLTFVSGMRTETAMATPSGMMQVEADTKSVDFAQDDEKYRLVFVYELSTGDTSMGTFEVDLCAYKLANF